MRQDRPFRVLHVAPTPFFSDRGCHIRIEGIVKALAKRGVASTVCTYHHGRDRPNVDTRRIGDIKQYRATEAGPNRFKYLADLKLFWLVCRCIRSERPDLIHAHLHEGVLLGWAARWFSMKPGIPLVADIQGSLVGELGSYDYFGGSKVLLRIFHWIEYVILRMPRRIFCSSVSSMALLQHDYGLSKGRLILLSDRVDAEATALWEKENNKHRTTVIYSGALLASKGLDELHCVIEQLLARRNDVSVVLVGYPVEQTAEFLRAKGLEQRCEMTGRVDVDDLPKYLLDAHIALDPKVEGAGEGSGKILNYMAAGLPVVAFESDNNRDFLGQQQYLVPSGSLDQFVDRIEFLIDNPETREQEGEHNRRRAHNELTWDAGIGSVLGAYDDLLSDSR